MARKSKTIAEAFRAPFAQAKKTTTEYRIALTAGMDQGQLSRIIAGKNEPKLSTADKMLRAIGFKLAIVPAGEK